MRPRIPDRADSGGDHEQVRLRRRGLAVTSVPKVQPHVRVIRGWVVASPSGRPRHQTQRAAAVDHPRGHQVARGVAALIQHPSQPHVTRSADGERHHVGLEDRLVVLHVGVDDKRRGPGPPRAGSVRRAPDQLGLPVHRLRHVGHVVGGDEQRPEGDSRVPAGPRRPAVGGVVHARAGDHPADAVGADRFRPRRGRDRCAGDDDAHRAAWKAPTSTSRPSNVTTCPVVKHSTHWPGS